VIEALEVQEPFWEPGTAYGYHAWTYGFLVGELIRRISGKTVGRFFAAEVAEPLGLDAWIGLPESIEPRVAHLEDQPPSAEWIELMMQFGPESLDLRAVTLNGAVPDLTAAVNTRQFRAAELPGINLVSDARSLARMYAASFSEVDGHRLLSPATVAKVSAVQTVGLPRYGWPEGMEEVLDQHFALGFLTPTSILPLLGPRSYGHNGAGGSLGFADPDLEVGFGYVMNRMEVGMVDPRPNAIVAAIASHLKG
jgi:CubicO group peptidase (beta-lactamase class C family)